MRWSYLCHCTYCQCICFRRQSSQSMDPTASFVLCIINYVSFSGNLSYFENIDANVEYYLKYVAINSLCMIPFLLHFLRWLVIVWLFQSQDWQLVIHRTCLFTKDGLIAGDIYLPKGS